MNNSKFRNIAVIMAILLSSVVCSRMYAQSLSDSEMIENRRVALRDSILSKIHGATISDRKFDILIF